MWLFYSHQPSVSSFLYPNDACYKTTNKRKPNCSTQVNQQVGYQTNDLEHSIVPERGRERERAREQLIQNENSCETTHSHDKARGVASFSHGEASQPHDLPFLACSACLSRPGPTILHTCLHIYTQPLESNLIVTVNSWH